MRPNDKRTGAKRTEGSSRYSKPKPQGGEKVRIIKQIIVKEEKKEDPNLIFGRNAVMEILKSGKSVECLYITEGDKEGSINKILGYARDNHVLIKYVDRKKLDAMTLKGNHQGIAAKITEFKYSEVSDILEKAKELGEKPFIVILDEIEDPHNLGSIIRTAELAGVHGIIIPKRRSVGVSATVYKTSAGAVENMMVARVTNLASETDELKKQGLFIYGADMDSDVTSDRCDFKGACALVIGNEGKGISRIMREKCDTVVSIPMVGKLNSLNASVAGGILMYEIMVGRLKEKQSEMTQGE